MVLHVRGIVLPEREERSPWIDGGVLVGAAVQEATASGAAGWCKIIGDWAAGEPPVRLDVLREAAAAVHAVGGKVSVHAQTEAGCPAWPNGAPADLVAFTEDPVAHPDVLHHPGRIILRGQILA